MLKSYITSAPTEKGLEDLRAPYVFINPTGGPADEDEPGICLETITLTLVVATEGDQVGERAHIGGHLSRGDGASAGKGLLEIQREIFSTIKFLNETTGITVQLRRTAALGSVWNDQTGFTVGREYTFEVTAQTDPTYGPVFDFRAVDAAGDRDWET